MSAAPPGLVEQLPPVQRLALAYAPSAARGPTLALLALDCRLAGILRHSHEAMLVQLRLAWWREQLASDGAAWPEGEPLLAAMRSWNGSHPSLACLVDGWENLTGPAPLPASALAAFAEGRGAAFAALAGCLGHPRHAATALRLGRNWALADLAARVSHAGERGQARALAAAQDWRWSRLPRSLRPLAVLHGLAASRAGKARWDEGISLATLPLSMRIGLLGW